MNNQMNLAIAFFSLFLMSYFGVYKFISKDASELSYYQSAHLVYPAQTGTNMSQYAVIADVRRSSFGFAESEGRNLNIKLYLAKSALISLQAKATYGNSKCNAAGIEKAVLVVSSPHVLSNQSLLSDKLVSLSFQAYKGDELSVTVNNASQPGCGGAFVTLYEKNQARHYPMVFVAIWSILIVLFFRLNLPLSLLILAASVNFLWLLASKGNGITSLTYMLHTTLVGIMYCGCWLVVFGVMANRVFRTVLVALITLFFLALPIVFIGHYFVFDAMPNIDTFHAILQSHKNQVIEFWFNILGLKYVLATALISLAVILGIYRSSSIRLNRGIAIVVGALMIAVGIRDYSTYLNSSPLFQTSAAAVGSYFQELEAFQRLRDSRENGADRIIARTEQSDSTLVVVIGESASKVHMSSYGYPRKTTPTTDALIDEGEMIRFNAAYSNHTYSNPTISRALTAASNYNGKQWSGEPSIMNILNAAGIRTTWISNKLKFGPWDNVMSVIGDDAQRTIHINTKVGRNLISNRYDGALVPLLEQALNEGADNKVIFVHLQGSHVDYAARYPHSHRKYNELLDRNVFGSALNQKGFDHSVVNTYDNSIHYTDSVISQIIDLLKLEQGKAGLLYFSDHGENVFNRKSHNAALFAYDMAAIPMFLWANESWQGRYAEHWTALKSNVNAVFTNDHVFDTILGLTDTNSEYTRPQNDLSSAVYTEKDEPTTLHGARALNTDENRSYWLSKNFAAISADQGSHFAAKASSVGQATQIISIGVDTLQIELVVPKQIPSNTLSVVLSNNLSMDANEFFRLIEPSNLEYLTVLIKAFDQTMNAIIAEHLRELKRDLGVDLTVLVNPQNFSLLSGLDDDIKRGVTLNNIDGNRQISNGDLSEKIDELLASGNSSDAKLHIAVSAKTYAQLKESDLLANQQKKMSYIVDVSNSHSFQSQGLYESLRREPYWNQTDVTYLVLKYESLFAQ